MLRRVTRDMAVTSELPVLLNSIASSLAQHTGASFVRVFLYQTDDECDVCRATATSQTTAAPGVKRLHLHADAGDMRGSFRDHHALSLDTPSPPTKVARERKPFLTNDLPRDVVGYAAPDLVQFYRDAGVVAAGAQPLEFRGELMGVMGMIGRRPFDPQEFELLGIFADQAGMAIKSAHLFAQLERYKERLQVENAYLQEEIRSERGFEEIVGQSPALRAVLRKVKQVAAVDTTVLLTGETGTGKELIARAIHDHSREAHEPFVPINCTAVPATLLESELFGHVRGAITGAQGDRRGKFALAGRGAIFLDEIGDTSADFQTKLLRVLQERQFYPVGADRPERTEARVIAATHRDLEAMVAAGQFRADLYYRLRVVEIVVPPLRERAGDLPLLATTLARRAADAVGRPEPVLAPDALAALARHAWPGNVRELENCLTRAVVVASGDVIRAEHLVLGGAASEGPAKLGTLDDVEREHVLRVLAATRGHKARAAQILGISRPRLDRILARHAIGSDG